MRNTIKMSMSMTVILVCVLGIAFTTWAETGEGSPMQLTFVYNRPKDHLITQWLILIYTEALAGCDALTIGPKFLQELQEEAQELPRILSEEYALAHCQDEKIEMDEKTFRWMLNEDAMATEKLAEGIRRFSADIVKLERYVKPKL